MSWSDDPVKDYDRYSSVREERYQALIEGMTCADCAHARVPEDDWGDVPCVWCDQWCEFVGRYELVRDTECEWFE